MKLPAEFSFDPEEHRFTLRGEPVPSVTQILKDMGFIRFFGHNTEAMQRGTDVHLAISMMAKGILDEESVDESLWPYVEAAQDFMFDFKLKVLDTEEIVFNRAWNYAGIVDLRAPRLIVDFKTGVKTDWHGLQLNAYALCWPRAKEMMCVYLKANGRYTIDEPDRADADEWRHIVRAYRRKHA